MRFFESYMLKRAAKGDKAQAQAILSSIARDLTSDRLTDGPFKTWLALALTDISNGGDANKVLMVAGQRGRTLGDEDENRTRNFEIYFALQAAKEAEPGVLLGNAIYGLSNDVIGDLNRDSIPKTYRRFVKKENLPDLFNID